MGIVAAKEYRTCDMCNGEKIDITNQPRRTRLPKGWSVFDYEGGRAEIGPKCTAKVLKKAPELAKAAAEQKTLYGSDGDCG